MDLDMELYKTLIKNNSTLKISKFSDDACELISIFHFRKDEVRKLLKTVRKTIYINNHRHNLSKRVFCFNLIKEIFSKNLLI